MSKTMRQWVMSGFGRSNLALAETKVPEPGPGQILVRVAAVSLNFRDRLVVEQGMGMPLAFPFTPGSDLSGTVAAVGPGVTRFKAGDRVVSTFVTDWLDGELDRLDGPYGPALGAPMPGVLADYVVLSENWAVPAPATLDHHEASTLPVAALTAWFSLVELGHLKAGETVLVQGTGGVALYAVQFAAAHHAEVIVTSSSDEKLARAKALGATHGINRNKTPDWGAEVQRLTRGRGADHLLELAAGDLDQSLQAIRPGGRISAIGVIEDYAFRLPALPLLVKHVVLQGIFVGHRRAFEDMNRAIDRLKIKPVIDKVYGLADLPAALDHLERGPFGKIVIRLAA
jgi:NADPH:quinone reductase-like Zn-dependent oxidoreductase